MPLFGSICSLFSTGEAKLIFAQPCSIALSSDKIFVNKPSGGGGGGGGSSRSASSASRGSVGGGKASVGRATTSGQAALGRSSTSSKASSGYASKPSTGGKPSTGSPRYATRPVSVSTTAKPYAASVSAKGPVARAKMTLPTSISGLYNTAKSVVTSTLRPISTYATKTVVPALRYKADLATLSYMTQHPQVRSQPAPSELATATSRFQGLNSAWNAAKTFGPSLSVPPGLSSYMSSVGKRLGLASNAFGLANSVSSLVNNIREGNLSGSLSSGASTISSGAGVYNSVATLAGKTPLPGYTGMLGALPSAANFAGTVIDGKPGYMQVAAGVEAGVNAGLAAAATYGGVQGKLVAGGVGAANLVGTYGEIMGPGQKFDVAHQAGNIAGVYARYGPAQGTRAILTAMENDSRAVNPDANWAARALGYSYRGMGSLALGVQDSLRDASNWVTGNNTPSWSDQNQGRQTFGTPAVSTVTRPSAPADYTPSSYDAMGNPTGW